MVELEWTPRVEEALRKLEGYATVREAPGRFRGAGAVDLAEIAAG